MGPSLLKADRAFQVLAAAVISPVNKGQAGPACRRRVAEPEISPANKGPPERSLPDINRRIAASLQKAVEMEVTVAEVEAGLAENGVNSCGPK